MERLTEREICIMYRDAKNKNTQVQILADLNGTSRIEIIKILAKNGETLPSRVVNQLYKRLDVLDAQISEREREYREIAQVLKGGKKIEQEENQWRQVTAF